MNLEPFSADTASGYCIRCDFKDFSDIHDEVQAPTVRPRIYLAFTYGERRKTREGIQTSGPLFRILSGGARESAQQACIGHSESRQATATNRDSLPHVDAPMGTRFARLRVTGSVQAEWNASLRTLGLDSTEDGIQMEQGDSISPKPKVCPNEKERA